MNFKDFFEGQNDYDNLQRAEKIANTIIAYAESPPYSNAPELEYESRSIDGKWQTLLKLKNILPEYPNLKLMFLPQAGKFGKNNYDGYYDRDTIAIALPNRTRETAIVRKNFDVFGKLITNKQSATLNPTVAKFLKKPESYDTLVHEIIHFLDVKRTKNKVFKSYPKDIDDDYDYYINHPAEYNARLNAFYAVNKALSLEQMTAKLKTEEWYNKLKPDLQRNVIKRIYLLKNYRPPIAEKGL